MHTLAAGSDATSVLGTVFGTIGIILAYWLPSIYARMRHVPGFGQVVVVNLFLGWTVIGWVIALAMAFRHVPAEPGQPN